MNSNILPLMSVPLLAACAASVGVNAGQSDAHVDAPPVDVTMPDTRDAPTTGTDVEDAGPLPVARLSVHWGVGWLRRSDGTTYAWGDQVDALTPEGRDAGADGGAVRAVPSLDGRVFAGHNTFCQLDMVGALRCWGNNERGQLGNGGITSTAAPGEVVLDSVVDVAAGWGAWCALRRDQSVWCWGRYAGTSEEMPPGLVPTRITIPGQVVRLFGGTNAWHFVALDSMGRMWCWGSNFAAQCTTMQRFLHPDAVQIPVVPDIRTVALAGTFTCALSGNGEVRCWGGQTLGINGERDGQPGTVLYTPTLAPAYAGAVDLAAGPNYLCALLPSGQVQCGGEHTERGVLGFYSRQTGPFAPRLIPSLDGVVELRAGRDHNCARTASDDVFCWGANTFHQLGLPDQTAIPQRVPARQPQP